MKSSSSGAVVGHKKAPLLLYSPRKAALACVAMCNQESLLYPYPSTGNAACKLLASRMVDLAGRLDDEATTEAVAAPLAVVTDARAPTAFDPDLPFECRNGRAVHVTVSPFGITGRVEDGPYGVWTLTGTLLSLVGVGLSELEAYDLVNRPVPAKNLAAAGSDLPADTSFQARVAPWLVACFGTAIAGDRVERNHRFLEEAIELVQACGATASEAHQLVDYVFGRPVGEPTQEVGGVMVTLAALCRANDLDMAANGETELTRIWTKVPQIRAKQAAKPKHSPLPEQTEPLMTDAMLAAGLAQMPNGDPRERERQARAVYLAMSAARQRAVTAG